MAILLLQVVSIGALTETAVPLPVYAQSQPDFLQYENTDMGIRIDYPSNWKIEGADGAITFYSPLENSLDQFSENVVVTLEYLPESISLQEYVDFSNDQLELVGYEILESKSSTISNYPASQTTATINFEEVSAKQLFTSTIKNDIAFVIIYTALPETFSNYFPIFEEMIDSFVILEEEEVTGKDIRQLMQEATKLYYQQMLNEALDPLDTVLIIQPDNYDALLLKSQILMELGKSAEAEKTIDKVLEIDPFDFEAQYIKGIVLFDQQKFEQAISYIDEYIKIVPNDSTALAIKSLALSQIGNYNEAESIIDKAIELNPDDPFAMYGKGYYFYMTKNYDQALLYYDKALEILPNDPDFLNDKGVVLLDQNKMSEAEAIFDEVLKINPNHLFGLNNKGIILLDRGDHAQALDYFDKGLEIDPDNPLLLRNKIATLSNLGIMDIAEITYNKLLQKNPEFDESLEEITTGVTSFENGPETTEEIETKTQIPDWIRSNASWWVEGSIDDDAFVGGIQFLIKEGLIQIPETAQTTASDGSQEIPAWIKNSADWWSQGLISDDDFIKGIQFMVENGIIIV
jgi:tetratricopeptide (TPR) repeat protein